MRARRREDHRSLRAHARKARAAGAAVACVCVLLLLACGVPADAMTSAQITSVINAERHANGLPLVREDTALSAGCAQYDQYRRLNGSLEDAFTLHEEIPSKPGYTPAGAQAVLNSLQNAGDLPTDSFAAGDVFDSAPNHLVALMDPNVAVIGADQLDFAFGVFGSVSLSCIDIRSAPARPPPRRLRVYAYVGPDGKAPADPSYREGPAGSGPFVYLYFDAPSHTRVTLRSVSLRSRTGAVIKPSYLAVRGGLLYPSKHASTAVTEKVAAQATPRLELRIPPGVAEKEVEGFVKYRDRLEAGMKAGHETSGVAAVPFLWNGYR